MKRSHGLGLVSALALTVAAAPAQAELEVTLGGYTAFQAAAFGNDDPTSTDRDFQTEAEVYVRADGQADNGLKYGVHIELLASTSDTANVDEANIYVENAMGRVELGDQDGAGSNLAVTAPYVGLGQAMGSFNDYIPAADRAFGRVDAASDPSFKAVDSSDATKVTYYTPKFHGLQAGISYAPERSDDGEDVTVTTVGASDHENMVELGLNYAGEVQGVGVKLGGAYNMADARAASAMEDIKAWTVGMQLSYQGFAFGGGYTDNGHSGLPQGWQDDDVDSYNVGMTYEQGAWGVGASYVHVDFDQNGSAFGVAGVDAGGSFNAYGLGGVYKVAPGLTLGADLVFFDRDRLAAGADTDGYVFVTEARAAF